MLLFAMLGQMFGSGQGEGRTTSALLSSSQTFREIFSPSLCGGGSNMIPRITLLGEREWGCFHSTFLYRDLQEGSQPP